MDWQMGLVAAIVAAAVVYLGRQAWRSWRGAKSGCGGGCSCGTKKGRSTGDGSNVTMVPVEQLTLRRHSDGRA